MKPRSVVLHACCVQSVILGIKTSSGKVAERGLEGAVQYYWWEYPREKEEELREWLLKAWRSFPSVLEHYSATWLVEGLSRVASHQLVRHRIASYTQESQRYSLVLPDDPGFRAEVRALREAGVDKAEALALASWLDEVKASGELTRLHRILVVPPGLEGEERERFLRGALSQLMLYADMVAKGVPEEDARYILPQAMATRILVTMNLREFLHVVSLRATRHAQWEIRDVVAEMARALKEKDPRVAPLVDHVLAQAWRR